MGLDNTTDAGIEVEEASGNDGTVNSDRRLETIESTSIPVVGIDLLSAGRLFARGAMAFVLGYVLLGVIVLLGPSRVAEVTPELIVNLGFIYYGAHNVSLVAPDVTYNSIVLQQEHGGTALPVAVFFLLPVGVLVATGVDFARRRLGTTFDSDRLLPFTLVIALGYATLALAGTLLVRTGSVHPSYPRAAVFGLAYPIVFLLVGVALVVGWRRVRN